MTEIFGLSSLVDDDGLITINLDEECENCNGKGKVADFGQETFAKCVPCDGRGKVLTMNGEDLLRFLRGYA